MLLDQEMRSEFINRAFREIWKLSDEKANAKPGLAVRKQTLDQACVVAVRIRQKASETPLMAGEVSVLMTVSGIAGAQSSMRDFDELMKRADGALYEAKRVDAIPQAPSIPSAQTDAAA